MAEEEKVEVVEVEQQEGFTPINSKEELETLLTKAKEEWTNESQKTIANERKRYEEKTKKLEKEIELSKLSEADRLKQVEADAKKQQEEELNSLKNEIETLKLEKRNNEIKSKLLENKLPQRYLNDVRLLHTENVDETIKVLKKEYDIEKADILKTNIRDTAPNISNTTSKSSEETTLERMLSYTSAKHGH